MNKEYLKRGIPPILQMNQIMETYGPASDNVHHYVLWSGGTDSTLCLYELLDCYGSDRVTAISYRFPWLDSNKWASEQHARQMFKDKMKLKGRKYSNFTHVELSESINILQQNDVFGTFPRGLPQAIAWLFSLPIFIRDNSYVYAGSIKEDDLTLFTTEYREIIKNLSFILNRDFELREPYLYYRKADILEKLMVYDLYDVTWHCELPHEANKPCCNCVPCRTHYNALLMLWQWSESPYVRSISEKKAIEISNARKELERVKEEKVSEDFEYPTNDNNIKEDPEKEKDSPLTVSGDSPEKEDKPSYPVVKKEE